MFTLIEIIYKSKDYHNDFKNFVGYNSPLPFHITQNVVSSGETGLPSGRAVRGCLAACDGLVHMHNPPSTGSLYRLVNIINHKIALALSEMVQLDPKSGIHELKSR